MERETREMAIQNIKLIQPFDGDRNYLALFIQGVEAIMPQSPVISEETKVFYLHCVIKILRGAALDSVRREQPPDWMMLRLLLIDEFGEHTAVSTLILEISNIKFKNNVKLLCEEINLEVCKVKDVIKLKNEICSTKIFLYNELDKISLKTLKRELPNYLTALINANLATDLILKENDVYENNKQFSKQKTIQRTNANSKLPNYMNNNNNSNIEYFATNTNQFPVRSNYNTFSKNYPLSNQNNYYKNKPFFNEHSNQQYTLQNNHFSQVRHTPFNSANIYTNRNLNNLKQDKIHGSNQSRLRRFGYPEPMEQDEVNFHLTASEGPPQLN
ncbi:putative uncharacterized protein DDB_G0282499 [Bactrocera tryoni]|uniref:putative uncharacterized protein DDB_G0282499 n=1 Tax=Bactrocera tryoni TaxID=59916 RepID=UPI001A959C93|nr:putative uncharacterized protein DDB_G0282499 [Bactrocera tryoni]